MVSRILLPEYLTRTIYYVKDNFLSKSFEKKNYLNPDLIRDFNVLFLEMSNGDVIEIPRPNHGTPHSARVAAYIPLVVDFLKKHGNHDYEFINNVNYLSPNDIYYLQICALFSVTGRLDETGFGTASADNKAAKIKYRSYREASAEALLSYDLQYNIFGSKENVLFWSSVVREMGNTPYIMNDEESMKAQAEIFPKPNRYYTKSNTAHVVDLILHLAHCMDLFRCHNFTVDNPLELLKRVCKQTHPDFTKDYVQLMQFAVTAILKTGNKIKYYMDNDGVIKKAGAKYLRYQDNFLPCNTKVEYLMHEINSIPLPHFYSGMDVSYFLPMEDKDISIKSSKLPVATENKKKPIAHYLDEAAIFNAADKLGGVYLAFADQKNAVQCLESIKNLLKKNDPSIEKALVSHYTFKKTNTPWRFRLLDAQYSVLKESKVQRLIHRQDIRHSHATPTLLPKDDIYIKHVRCDSFGYYYSFTKELVDTTYRLDKRIGTKKEIRVNGLGPNSRSDNSINSGYPRKESKYTALEKKNYTKAQSTSLAFKERYSSVFGWDKRESLVIFMFGKNSVLLSDYLTIYDTGTVNRPFDVFVPKKAAEINKNVGKTVFKADDLPKFKTALTSSVNKNKHNEVLARLQWQIVENDRNEENKIGIAKDNFETRMLAKQYALSFEIQLKKAGKCRDDYSIPVVYYLPEEKNLLFKEYTYEEYELDCLHAYSIKNNKEKRQEKYKENRFEFLLGLSSESIRYLLLIETEEVNKLPLPLYILKNGYTQIFLFLQEKSGLKLETILGKALIAEKNNEKLMLSILYHALMGEALDLAEFIDKQINIKNFTKYQAEDETSPLIAAVVKNHLPWAQRLLNYKCINPNIKHERLKHNAFYMAIYCSRPDIVREFISKGTKVNDRAGHSKSPLFFAVENSSTEIVKILMENGAQNASVNNEQTPSQLALEYQRFDVLNVLFKGHPAINTVEIAKSGLSSEKEIANFIWVLSLNLSIERNEITRAKKYIPIVSMNEVLNGSKPLPFACKLKHFAIVQLIAEFVVPDKDNQVDFIDAFTLAVKSNEHECAKALFDCMNRYFASSGSFLIFAIFTNQYQLFKDCLQYKSDLSVRFMKSHTPIQLAAKLERYDMVKLIADSYPDLHDQYGYREVLHHVLSAKPEQHECLKSLLIACPHPEVTREDNGNTLLHQAIADGDDDAVAIINKHGTHFALMHKNKNGETPIQLAYSRLKYSSRKFDFIKSVIKPQDDNNCYGYNEIIIDATILALNGQMEMFDLLLSSNASVNSCQASTGNSLLHLAILKPNKDVLLKLLQAKNINLALKNDDKKTPMQLAADKRNAKCMQLIAESKNTNENDSYGYGYALIPVVDAKNHNLALSLLTANASTGFCDEQGNTVYHIAIEKNDEKMLRLLLKYKTHNLAIQNYKGETPIQQAARLGHSHLVKVIAECVKTDANDAYGYNKVVFDEINRGRDDVLLNLLSADVSVNTVEPKSGNSLLHLAISAGSSSRHTRIVRILLSLKEIDITIRNKQGETCIQLALRLNRLDLIKIIAKKINADKNIISNDYGNALFMAASIGNHICANALLKAGAPIISQDSKGELQNPLHPIIENDDYAMLGLLLSHDIDFALSLENTKSLKPIMHAYKLNRFGMIDFIVESRRADEVDSYGYGKVLIEFIQASNYDRAKYLMIKSGVRIQQELIPNFEALLNQVVADNESEIASCLLGYDVDLSHMAEKGNASDSIQFDYALRSCATHKNPAFKTEYLDLATLTKGYNQLIFDISIIFIQGGRQATVLYSYSLPLLQTLLNYIIRDCGLIMISKNNSIPNINTFMNKISRDCFLKGYSDLSIFKRTGESKNLNYYMTRYQSDPQKVQGHINDFVSIAITDTAKHAEPLNLLVKYHLVEESDVKQLEIRKDFEVKLSEVNYDIKSNPDNFESYYQRACHYKNYKMLNLALTDYIKSFEFLPVEIDKSQFLGETIETLLASAEKVEDFNGISKYKLFDLIKTFPDQIQISLLSTCLDKNSLMHIYLKQSTNVIGGLLRSVNLNEYTGSEKLLVQMEEQLQSLHAKKIQNGKNHGI